MTKLTSQGVPVQLDGEQQKNQPSLHGSDSLSPLMRQYWEIKAQYADALLFFRLGDFYELFDQDAQVASRELDITLTGRPDPAYPSGRVPMAGVPFRSAEAYLAKLLSKGYSVAICDQVGVVGTGKGPVERQVTRVLTPGTVLEASLLPARENNYLVALLPGLVERPARLDAAAFDLSSDLIKANSRDSVRAPESMASACRAEDGAAGRSASVLPAPYVAEQKRRMWGLAYVDASCGEFCVTQLTEEQVILEIGRLNPREILVPKRSVRPLPGQVVAQEVLDVPAGLAGQYRISGRPSMFFQVEPAQRRIMQAFAVSTLEGFGCHDMPLAIGAAGAVLEYLERTQGAQMPRFAGISAYSVSGHLVLDPNTRRNLELTETVRDRSFEGSLLWAIDRTKSGMGSRLLRKWLLEPLYHLEAIKERQQAVAELTANFELRRQAGQALARLADLERLAVKLSSGTILPRELTSVQQSLSALPQLSCALSACSSPYLTCLAELPPSLSNLAETIAAALSPDAPREMTEGDIFAQGYSEELDQVRSLLGGGKEWIESFQASEQERTGIRSLKINYNSTFGYYIEVTHANNHLVPADYVRKQTLTNAERYITPELKEYEARILNAEKTKKDLEYKLYIEFRKGLTIYGDALMCVARHLAALDALLSLSAVAVEGNYVCPKVDDSLILEIKNGRHPVLERLLPTGMLVANDTRLEGQSNDHQLVILTGPNMSGKSSLLRQIAHIVILAQMGSFVPADEAVVGLVDRIFTRIGAVDDLTQGQSTFLVEMSETAQCCLCATERSLILLDEVGRGTSTYDGVAIAWAVAEYLASSPRSRVMFATHYHELNGLASFFPQIVNYQVLVRENEGHVEFIRRVVPGGASRSYGVQVARMAGLPLEIIDRARNLMAVMEKRGGASQIVDGPKMRNIEMEEVMQLTLF